jgi:D-sedoheptulose 7-phosphate isomerase
MMLEETIRELQNIDKDDVEKLKSLIKESDKIVLVGNGGSNAIASHIMVDYNKFLQKPTVAPTDASMLTAYTNDYGVDGAFSKYLDDVVVDNTLVILISSSGESENINTCARFCCKNKIKFILLTGFDKNNLIRHNYCTIANLDFWVNSRSYGVVECVHQIFLHSIVNN